MTQETAKPILITTRKGTPMRVLRPKEFEAIRNALPTEAHKNLLDIALHTGMRYSELIWFANNPTALREQSKSIYLPPEAQGKEKRVSPDRYVHLSKEGLEAAKRFAGGPKKTWTRAGWSLGLKRAAEAAKIDTTGLSAKTLRKTMESWLVYVYVFIEKTPDALHLIAKSFGHTSRTAVEHYVNLDFTKEDIDEMKIITRGWLTV